MGLLDSVDWQGQIFKAGTSARFGGAAANIEAFTETRWITVRGEPARYPF